MPFHSPFASPPSRALVATGEPDCRGFAWSSSRRWTTTSIERSSSRNDDQRDHTGPWIHSLIPPSNARSSTAAFGSPDNDRGDTEGWSIESSFHDGNSFVVRTMLPPHVQRSFRIDTPLELVALEGVAATATTHSSATSDESSSTPYVNEATRTVRLSPLCVYSEQNAFILEIDYSSRDSGNDSSLTRDNPHTLPGRVVFWTEPLDEHIGDDGSTRIVRLLSAASVSSSRTPTSLWTPPRSFVCLVMQRDYGACQYSLLVHHGGRSRGENGSRSMVVYNEKEPKGVVTQPLDFGVEDIPEEHIVDMCLGEPCGTPTVDRSTKDRPVSLALFASCAVYFVQSSGRVLAASPVLVDGTAVPSTMVTSAVDYIQTLRQRYDTERRDSAVWRQCQAARRFLTDVFGVNEQENDRPSHHSSHTHIYTARVLSDERGRHSNKFAASWPLAIQGPIVSTLDDIHPANTTGSAAASIVAWGSGDGMATGLAVANGHGRIDLCAVAPTCVWPRFGLERPSDAMELNEGMARLASVVKCVDLGLSKESEDDTSNSQRRHQTSNATISSVTLVADPVIDTLLHYTTANMVATISSTALRSTSHQLAGRTTDPERTTAWTCLSSADTIQGVVVLDCSSLTDRAHRGGHQLLARLRNGTVERVDMTESLYVHEFETRLYTKKNDSPLLLTAGSPAGSSAPLFSDQIKPLIEQVQRGLGNMGRIVGSETNHNDITPDTLAVVVDIKKRCDVEVVVPLMELGTMIERYKEHINTILANQQKQLALVQTNIRELKSCMASMGETLEEAVHNATSLTERSAAVKQAAQALLPSVTHAEYDYFQDIKRLDVKCVQMEEKAQKLKEEQKEFTNESLEVSDEVRNMDAVSIKQANALLKYQREALKKAELRQTKSESLVREVAREHGIKI